MQQDDRTTDIWRRRGPLGSKWISTGITVKSLLLYNIEIVGRQGRDVSGSLAVDDIDIKDGQCPTIG